MPSCALVPQVLPAVNTGWTVSGCRQDKPEQLLCPQGVKQDAENLRRSVPPSRDRAVVDRGLLRGLDS
jgi:hypothetical protein